MPNSALDHPDFLLGVIFQYHREASAADLVGIGSHNRLTERRKSTAFLRETISRPCEGESLLLVTLEGPALGCRAVKKRLLSSQTPSPHLPFWDHIDTGLER